MKLSTETTNGRCVVYGNRCTVMRIFYGVKCHKKAIDYITKLKENLEVKNVKKIS